MKMVVHNGKRYRPEDAERLGIAADKPKPAVKGRKRAPNKARRSASDKGQTGG